jgi:hypothetical protein
MPRWLMPLPLGTQSELFRLMHMSFMLRTNADADARKWETYLAEKVAGLYFN